MPKLDFLAAADSDRIDTTPLIYPTLLPGFLDFHERNIATLKALGQAGWGALWTVTPK